MQIQQFVVALAFPPFGLSSIVLWMYFFAALLLIIGVIKIVLELPREHGLDKVMPARGGTLSGSERRRLALVRLLLRDPDVILVDEIEAGLPQVMAVELFGAVRELGRGKTLVMVTHRPDLLHTDRVIFVHEGAILATGTHEELARSCEPYRSLLADKETTA